MSKFHYCTIASINHLFKVITMRNSLASKCRDYRLSILCFDDGVYEVLSCKNWSDVELIRLKDIEDTALWTAKGNRDSGEYAWTLKPAILRYVMYADHNADYFAFLDADVYFFSNPNKIFDESPESYIFLTDHNNSPRFMEYYDISGRFNSGFVGCRNCETALKAIDWWRSKSVDWCYARYDMEKKRYGDQRYLEEIPVLFPNVCIIKSKGVNAAHWNIQNSNVAFNGKDVYLDYDKLVFYHFSGLFIYNSKEYNLSWAIRIPEEATRLIYLPYLWELKKVIEEIESAYPAYRHYGFQRAEPHLELHYTKLE